MQPVSNKIDGSGGVQYISILWHFSTRKNTSVSTTEKETRLQAMNHFQSCIGMFTTWLNWLWYAENSLETEIQQTKQLHILLYM